MLKGLSQKLKPLLKKHKFLEDIIIFGSFVREKAHPKDIDLAFLVHEKTTAVEDVEEESRKLLPEFRIDIIVMTLKEIYSSLWLSIITEGWSVAQDAFLPGLYGIQPSILYKYSLKTMTPVQKVQFDRGMKILLEELEGIRLTRTIILIPLQKSGQFEDFLKTWKIEFETQRYTLLPEHQKTEKIVTP